jgi:hypothetical protein
MTRLTFELPDGEVKEVAVTTLLNAGFAARDRKEVDAHIGEMAALGIPAPQSVPVMYPISPYLAQQTDEVHVQHGRTSGEAEWALVVAGESSSDVLLTVGCDHTDRDLERTSIPWSKNAGPDVLAKRAWRLSDVTDHVDDITLTAWVGEGDHEPRTLIQHGTLANLLAPDYWLKVLEQRELFRTGTILMSGTILMIPEVDQFADSWRVEMRDPTNGNTLDCAYRTTRMPEPIC